MIHDQRLAKWIQRASRGGTIPGPEVTRDQLPQRLIIEAHESGMLVWTCTLRGCVANALDADAGALSDSGAETNTTVMRLATREHEGCEWDICGARADRTE